VKTDVTMVHLPIGTPPGIHALATGRAVHFPRSKSAMDELAIKLKMDPVALRRVNDAMKDATRQAMEQPLA